MLSMKQQMPYWIALLALVCAGVLKLWTGVDAHEERIAFDPSQLPHRIAGWNFKKKISMTPFVHKMLREDASEWSVYRNGNEYADLLVLYGHRKRTFHLPDSCLAGSGFTVKSRQMVVLKVPGKKVLVPFHALVLQKDDESRLALYTFVGPNGKPMDLLELNAGMIFCRIRGVNPKGAAIRVIGLMNPGKPIGSQSICGLAAAALQEVGKRVRDIDNRRAVQDENDRRVKTTLLESRFAKWQKC